MDYKNRRLVTFALYLYVLCVVCPIRYWPLQANIDQTWRFALNYAHAQGLAPGTEVVFTSGPLGYLTFPEHFASNLEQGLIFQTVLWLVLALVFSDVFFRHSFPIRNLALFSLLLGLSADLFWFDFLGLENLLLAAAIILLVLYEFRGGIARYLLAAGVFGLLPFIKLTAGAMGFGVLLGFLMARVFALRLKAWPDLLIAGLVPAAVGAVISVATLPSGSAFAAYVRGSFEVTAGFSSAMAMPGSPIQLAAAALAIAILGFMISLLEPKTARFYVLLLTLPLFISFKHGFVRQDPQHAGVFFCFIAFALSLVALKMTGLKLAINKARVWRVLVPVACFSVLWIANLQSLPRAAAESSGLRGLWMAARALPISGLEKRLDAASAAFPPESQLEPELIRAIGRAPVASLSIQFSNLEAAHLQVRLYPVVQLYAAYTPYLDHLDARWISEHGPRFLVFDGDRIDVRDIWAQTPAVWLEVYRWYDTRLLGSRNLLLERRTEPRFSSLHPGIPFQFNWPGSLRLPASSKAVFWKMQCHRSALEALQTMLFRAPVRQMSVHRMDGTTRTSRVISEMLGSPVLGNYLPGKLDQFARLFESKPAGSDEVSVIEFAGGSGASCQVTLLMP